MALWHWARWVGQSVSSVRRAGSWTNDVMDDGCKKNFQNMNIYGSGSGSGSGSGTITLSLGIAIELGRYEHCIHN